MKPSIILGIESSCDETAASILLEGWEVASNIVASQIKVHKEYGGIVPELASRQHLKAILWVVERAVSRADIKPSKINAIAVTQGPGLVGSLVVGWSFAKAMAKALNIPITGVNHLHAHLLSIFFSDKIPTFPYIGLVVSGGHTNLFIVEDYLSIKSIGKTRDDAAGEAFDKVAKLLNLEYPGGPVISKLGEKGDPDFIAYPRARLSDTPFDFSFSGLKTSVITSLQGKDINDKKIVSDICASFQEAVVDVLVEKTVNAAKFYNISDIVVCGGVASNKRLRSLMDRRCKKESIRSFFPELSFCTDNASMVALAGYYKLCAHMEIKDGDDVYSRSAHRWTI